MADTSKVLGQAKPAGTTLTDLYTVPGATSTVVSSITVTNQSTATSFRLSVAVAGAADALSQYIAYDVPLGANETKTFTLGITLAATDKLRCYSASGNVSFSAFGIETA